MSFVPDSGGGIGAALGTAGLDVQAVKMAGDEAQKLIESAKSGGFKISPEGLAPLKTALTDMSSELDRLMSNTPLLVQAPKLGDHPYGHTVSAHDQKGASVAAGSAMDVLTKFRQVLADADEALTRAAGLYKGTEAVAISTFKDH